MARRRCGSLNCHLRLAPEMSQALMLKCLITFQKRLTCVHSGAKYGFGPYEGIISFSVMELVVLVCIDVFWRIVHANIKLNLVTAEVGVLD